MDDIQGDGFLLLVLLTASLFDIWRYTVPNALVTAALLISLIGRIDAQGFYCLYPWLIGTFVPFFLTFIFYKLRMIGASDVKIFALVGSYAGVPHIFSVMAVSVIFGAVLSLAKIAARKNLRHRLHYFFCYIQESVRKKQIRAYYDRELEGDDGIIPFTVAISLAAILCLY